MKHILNCRSCWLDWQIQESARRSYSTDGGSRQDPELFQRQVMARIAARERDSDRPATLTQLTLSALLLAVAVLIFALERVQFSGPGALGGAAICATGIGVAWAWYSRARDKKHGSEQI